MEETEIESKVSRKKMFYLSKTLRIVSLLIYEAIFSPKRKKQTRQIHFFRIQSKGKHKNYDLWEYDEASSWKKMLFFIWKMHKHTHPVKSRVWWSETATIPAVVFSAMRERLHRLRVVRRVDGFCTQKKNMVLYTNSTYKPSVARRLSLASISHIFRCSTSRYCLDEPEHVRKFMN